MVHICDKDATHTYRTNLLMERHAPLKCELCCEDAKTEVAVCPGPRGCIICGDCYSDTVQFYIDRCSVCSAPGLYRLLSEAEQRALIAECGHED